MTIYKNDRRHFTKAYATADEAAINWTEIRNDTIARFMREGGRRETLGQYIERTGAPY